jgi:hypothetical protein
MSRIGRVIVDSQLGDEICKEIASKIQEIDGLDVNPATSMRMDIVRLSDDQSRLDDVPEPVKKIYNILTDPWRDGKLDAVAFIESCYDKENLPHGDEVNYTYE